MSASSSPRRRRTSRTRSATASRSWSLRPAADDPVRRYGAAEIAKIESLGFTGEVRGTPEQPGMGALASVNETEQPRYLPGATRGSALCGSAHRRAHCALRGPSRRSPPASCPTTSTRCSPLALRAHRGPPRRGRAPNVLLTILFAQLLAGAGHEGRRTRSARAHRAAAEPAPRHAHRASLTRPPPARLAPSGAVLLALHYVHSWSARRHPRLGPHRPVPRRDLCGRAAGPATRLHAGAGLR